MNENKTNAKRQIILETDGLTVNIVKAEATSVIEFASILNMAIDFVRKNAQDSQLSAQKVEKRDGKEEKKEETTEKVQ